MKKSILVTGISGSGKSALSEKLLQMGFSSYDLDAIPDLCSMIDKDTKLPVQNHDNADLSKVQKMDWICDKQKLVSIIGKDAKEVAFYCGTVSNMDEIAPLFDQIILLKAKPDVIRHRLTTRTTNDFGQTEEVQNWILSCKDSWEDEVLDKAPAIVDSNGPLEQVANDVIEAADAHS
jgi:dephospho-CoA kinase